MLFGYVTIDKSEMLCKDYESYRSVYCSLCKQLGKEYGILSKFILSYDCTFFAVVALSVGDTCPNFKQGRCPFNPTKKCNFICTDSRALSMAAALSVITAYYKIIDNISDGGFFTRLLCYLLLPVVSLWRKKAKSKFPAIEDAVFTMSQQQSIAEADSSCCIDKACEPTAKMLGTVMSLIEDSDENTLRVYYNFGYFLGKWIYLMDAVNDIDSDVKHHNFNVLLLKYKNPKSELDSISGTLNHCLSEILFSYNLFEHNHFQRIIENILLHGLPNKQAQVLSLHTNKKS